MGNDNKYRKSAKERPEQLSALWDALRQAMVSVLKDTAPEQLKGSTLKEIRQFLIDNGVTVESVVSGAKEQQVMTEYLENMNLPEFPDSDEVVREFEKRERQ